MAKPTGKLAGNPWPCFGKQALGVYSTIIPHSFISNVRKYLYLVLRRRMNKIPELSI
jgi:hypothetical protein